MKNWTIFWDTFYPSWKIGNVVMELMLILKLN